MTSQTEYTFLYNFVVQVYTVIRVLGPSMHSYTTSWAKYIVSFDFVDHLFSLLRFYKKE